MIKLTRFIDKYLGIILITILVIFKPFKFLFKKKNNKRIAITRIWTLGDTITLLPTLKKLKEKGYKLDIYTSFRARPVLELSNIADRIISFPKFIFKPLYYDYVIDTEPYYNFATLISFYMSKKAIGYSNLYRKLLYNYKVKWDKNKHVSENFSKLLKPLNIDFKPEKLIPLKYSQENKKKIDTIIKKYKNKKFIGLHLSMAETSKYRMWKLNNFEELIKKIHENYKNTIIVLTGSKTESITNKELIKKLKLPRVIDIAGTAVGELAYLMTKFKLYISNDTGPMHLSAAMGTRTIGLFGPNLPKRYGPLGENNITIYKANKLKCSPCIIPFQGKFRKCPYNGKCMDLISVEDVYNKVKGVLN